MGYKQRTTIKLLGELPKKKYVVTPKDLLLDTGLTSDAFRVGVYLLSLSDGWEVSQRGIATALGWPRGSHRPTNAIQNLVERGWLTHNEYKDGKRIYKHEYVMNRSRRRRTPQANDDESSSLYVDESSSSTKYHSKRERRSAEPSAHDRSSWTAAVGTDGLAASMESHVGEWSGSEGPFTEEFVDGRFDDTPFDEGVVGSPYDSASWDDTSYQTLLVEGDYLNAFAADVPDHPADIGESTAWETYRDIPELIEA
jgi:hypothetical protein